VAYLRTFARMGLKSIPMRAESGPIGGNLSHEFIILAQTGESEVFCHKHYLDMQVPATNVNFDDVAELQGIVNKWTSQYAATSEMHDAAAFGKVPSDKQVSARGIEVGHIFYFGTKYSEPMKAVVATPDGKEVPVHMGSYGIGPSRLVAAIIEASHDEAGIIWPGPVAPFKIAILNLKQAAAETDGACEQLYRDLTAKGVEVLYHDLDERPGAKFATADLIGIPYQVLVGPRGLVEGKVEIKKRSDGSRENISPSAAIDLLARLFVSAPESPEERFGSPRILCVDKGFDCLAEHESAKICVNSRAREPINDRGHRHAALLPVRMDAVAALSARAAQGRIHFGHRRIFFPRHHAGRGDAHHRDGGDERLPQGIARQNSRPQRSPADPASGKPTDRLGRGGRPRR